MNTISMLDSLFNAGLGTVPCYVTKSVPFVPKADVRQTKEAYKIDLELPGRTEDEFDITLEKNNLSIASRKIAKAAESDNASEEKKSASDAALKADSGAFKTHENSVPEKYLLRERPGRDFKRTFILPEDASGEEISASYKNGILNITIPRKPETLPRKINITCA